MLSVDSVLRDLRTAIQRGEKVMCVHYACENFYEVTDRPLAVTCVAVADPAGGQESAFSIANAPADDDPVEREKDLLKRFYEVLRTSPGARVVHWNMHSAHYGFPAIAARYRYLFEQDPPVALQADRLYDLDSLIEGRFGEAYAKHPKFRNIATLNGIYMPFFKAGKEEADAVKTADYGTIERSTSEKAHIIAILLDHLLSGTLRTQNSVGAVEFAGSHLDAVELMLTLGQRFLYVERALKSRYDDRSTLEVNNEYDAQDLLRTLLVLFFDDVRDEDYVQIHAGAGSRIDFVLPQFRLAVELKYTRENLRAKELGEQLIIDRDRYKARGGVQHLVFLVFDHQGFIKNPRGIESDLGRDHSDDEMAVTVKIYDR
jgi:REase_DpnII-MboI